MKWSIIAMISLVSLVSCQSYKEIPLNKGQILKDVENQRIYKGSKDGLSFKEAESLMSVNNTDLQVLKEEYEKLQSIAEIKTPYPNPSLEIGQGIGSSIEEKSASSVQPFIGLGFTIPLGPRLARNDDLNDAKKLSAYNDLVIRHRSLSLELRKVYSEYKIILSLSVKQQQLLNHLKLNYTTVKKMLELGQATVIDYNSARIQYESMKIRLLETKSAIQQSKSHLSSLLGKDIHEVKISENDVLDESLINFGTLKSKLMESNFILAQTEMKYKVAEVELKLELAKQYPDLEFGTSGEQEPGEKKKIFSLGLTLALPIFDRNQINITKKDKQRKVILAEYNSSLNHALNKLKLYISEYEIQMKKIMLLKAQIIPLSKDTVSKAEKAVQSGHLSILRYLDLSNELYRNELEVISSEIQLSEIIFNLENLVGEALFKID